MFSKKFLSGVALTALGVALAGPAAAQETTSAVRGDVTSTDGQPLSGAQVVVTHVPTGTRSSEGTDAGGVFDLRGLRVGGPYTIEVTADDFQGERVENVYLQIGTPFRISMDLEPSDEGIVVVGTSVGMLDVVGSNSVLNREDIEGAVSVTRDIRDLARRDPLVTQNSRSDQGISIAGSNPRTNRITIDGVQAQDDFGLNTGGLPTRRGPISLDAVRQFSVEAVPFDVENGDFIGGAINIVLREGSNDIDGSVFANYLNEGLVGTRILAPSPTTPGALATRQIDNTVVQNNWGATLRGPLWQDRLFFALSYETYESVDITSAGPAGAGFATSITGPFSTAAGSVPLTQTDIDAVTNIFTGTGAGQYGSTFPIGSIPLTKPITDEKYTGRFDWNITDDHLATLTFRHSESGVISRTNISSSSAGLDSQWYLTGEDDYTTSLQINSDWSDALSTEFRYSHRDYTRLQEPPAGQSFSDISVCSAATTNDQTQTTPLLTCRNGSISVAPVRFGPDLNRHANFLHTENTQAQFSAEYQAGAHLFKAGAQWQRTDIYNIFLPNSDGAYYFDSREDFSAGRAGSLTYRNAISGNSDDAAAIFAYDVTSLLAQDTWDLTDTLTLNYGARWDFYSVADEPANNPNFAARYPGLSNQETYDGRDVFMPRLSFTYDATSDIRVSGGVGLFSGGLPDVFLSNVFSNTGIIENTLTFNRELTSTPTSTAGGNGTFLRETTGAVNCAGVTPIYGGFTGQQVCNAALNVGVNSGFGDTIPTSLQAALGGTSASPTAETNSISPDFEIPSIWKVNLALGWDVADGLRLGLDAVGFQDQEGLAFRDLRAAPLIVNGARAMTPDGRVRYDSLSTGQHNAAFNGGSSVTSVNPGGARDIQAYNPDETPFSWVVAVSLSKEWDNGVDVGVSYAHQNFEEFASSARFSSTANSLYQGQFASFDPNTATTGRGQEEIEHSFKYNFGWRHEFVEELETRFTLFGEIRSGRTMNFVMGDGSSSTTRGSVFGVTRAGQLAYIPNLSGTVTTSTGLPFRSDAGAITTTGGQSTAALVSSDPLVSFDTAATATSLIGLLARYDITDTGIIDRGSHENHDIHRLDLQLSQELPAFRPDHRTLLTFDIANVLNLVNDEWGAVNEYEFSDVRLFNVSCAGADGIADSDGAVSCSRYRISSVNTSQAEVNNADASRWAIQIGLKYEF